MSFADFIGYYKLARSEGLVLRYLSRRLPRDPPDGSG